MAGPRPSTRAQSRRAFLAGLGSAALAGCLTQPNPALDDDGDDLVGNINIAGSSTVFPLATQMKQAFQDRHPEVTISVQSTGTGGGFQNHFCAGDTDFNNGSRPISAAEAALCEEQGVDWVELKVATDALTVIVNNEADWLGEPCLTVDTLTEIWRGDDPPQRWSEVRDDWPDEEMKLFGPTDASGTFDYFHEVVVGEDHDHRSDYQATEQDNTIIQGVAQNEYAMGYLGFAFYSTNADRVTALGVDDGEGCVRPALETAKSGEYTPLSRPLFTYASVASLRYNPAVAAFAEFFVRQSSSRELVADRVGYVPNSAAEVDEMLDRLAPYLDST